MHFALFERALFLLPLAGEVGPTKSGRMRDLAVCWMIGTEAATSLIRPLLTQGPPSPASGRRRSRRLLAVAAATAAFVLATHAHAADITITSPWLRATPKGAPVAGGYATITNKGTASDRLLGASIPMAPEGQVHEMSMENGLMHMARLAKGLPIAPGATVRLTPGGYHLMFLKPKALLKEGETVKGTLTFEKAGAIPVTFPVAGFGAKQAPGK